MRRTPFEKALRASTTHRHDYLNAYVGDLGRVIDMDAIRGAKISLGVDPLGGAGVRYWGPIAGEPIAKVACSVIPRKREPRIA